MANGKSIPAVGTADIVVTSDRGLHEVMIHEFPKPKSSGNYQLSNYDLNLDALTAFIARLTPQQVGVLRSYRSSNAFGADGRLVVFIQKTSDGLQGSMGGAIGTQDAKGVRSNAECAVFWCRPNEKAMLVAYTQRFWVTDDNWPKVKPKRLAPNASLDQCEEKKCVLSVCPMADAAHYSIWHALSDKGGQNLMHENYIHGLHNTNGCWMWFRNHNWPAKDYDRCMEAYVHGQISRNTQGQISYFHKAKYEELLIDIGYYELNDKGVKVVTYKHKDDPDARRSTCVDKKFRIWDYNYAYCWFCKNIVGVDYMTSEEDVAKRPIETLPIGYFHSAFNVAGDRLYATPPQEQRDSVDQVRGSSLTTTLNTHQTAWPKASFFQNGAVANRFLQTNKLGFQPQKKWPMSYKSKVSVPDETWADVLLYLS